MDLELPKLVKILIKKQKKEAHSMLVTIKETPKSSNLDDKLTL